MEQETQQTHNSEHQHHQPGSEHHHHHDHQHQHHHHGHDHGHSHGHGHGHDHNIQPIGPVGKAYFDEVAEYYAQHLEKVSLPLGITLGGMAQIEKAKSVVEVGCGAGMLSLHWIKTLPAGVKYTSVDLSDEMIRLANKRKEHIKNKSEVDHSFVVGDAQNLSMIPDESVDVYVSSLAFCHIPDPIKALKEALRVLRKDGRIGISLSIPTGSSFAQVIQKATAKFSAGGQEGHQHHHHGIATQEQLVKIAKEAGVEVDFCWVQDAPFDISDENDFVKLSANLGHIKRAITELGEEQREKYIEALKQEFVEAKKSFAPIQLRALLLTGRKPQ